MHHHDRPRFLIICSLSLLAAAACRSQPAVAPDSATPTSVVANAVTVTSAPTGDAAGAPPAATREPAALATTVLATPAPTALPSLTATRVPKTLTVCMALEPTSLFLFDPISPAARHVWQAIYVSPAVRVGYEYRAAGLARIPTGANGDARLETITVGAGDTVVDAQGFVQTLAPGVTLRTADGELVTYREGAVSLPRLVVDFTLAPLVWSDGVPVTADDWRFSFELAYGRDADNAARRDRVAAYEVTGDLALRYATVPGWIDTAYMRQVRPPLPRHQLASIPRSALPASDEATRAPLASGPFTIVEWSPGDRLILARNPHYFRAGEGLPRLDGLIFRFVPETDAATAALLAGSCDVVTQEGLALDAWPLLQANADAGLLQLSANAGPVFEHLAFAVQPADAYAARHRTWFADAAVRRATNACLDRQAIVDATMHGVAPVAHTYVTDDHPLVPPDLAPAPFDPVAGNRLLDNAGYVDVDGDGVREAPDGETPFRVTLATTSGGDLRPAVAELVAAQLAACGIGVEIRLLPVGELFADGPVGSIFGRQFDLGLFGWLTDLRPPCNLYLSSAIPGPPDAFSAGWSGVNVTGWADEAFDAACTTGLTTLPDSVDYRLAHAEALRRFADGVPAAPLFFRVRLSLSRPGVTGVSLEPLEESELWNIAEMDIVPGE